MVTWSGVWLAQHPEGDVLAQTALDLSGRAHPARIRVQQHAEQDLGVVGGVAVPVVAVGSVEPGQVELVDHLQHEPVRGVSSK
jgi:hypothetical protein